MAIWCINWWEVQITCWQDIKFHIPRIKGKEFPDSWDEWRWYWASIRNKALELGGKTGKEGPVKLKEPGWARRISFFSLEDNATNRTSCSKFTDGCPDDALARNCKRFCRFCSSLILSWRRTNGGLQVSVKHLNKLSRLYSSRHLVRILLKKKTLGLKSLSNHNSSFTSSNTC